MDRSSASFDLRREVESLLQQIDEKAYGRLGAGAIDTLRDVERCMSHLEALRAELLIEAADPEPRVDEFVIESLADDIHYRPRTIVIEDAIREEIAAALRWSPNHAGSLIEDARRLHAYLPATLEALRTGAITGRHASVLVEWSGRLSARHSTGPDAEESYVRACAEFEERVLRVARRSTVAYTRAAAKRALASLDAQGARQRREQQRCTRDVRIVEECDGISVLVARMSTPAARAVMEAVGKEAELIEDASLTVGERRAYALTSLVFGTVAPEVRLDVVLPATGESGELVEVSTDGNSVSLARITASMVSGLACATIDGAEVDMPDIQDLMADPDVWVTMRKLVVDPITGVLSGYGRSTYQVPKRLREFIVRRDRVCRFPGCARSARRSQIDHAQAWDDGGTTDPGNLGALCTRHHQLKTHGGWNLNDSRADGSCTWASPHGRRYSRRAEPLVEIGLQQQFARVIAAGLSSADVPVSTRHRSPDPPF